jgi:hypothetical protein
MKPHEWNSKNSTHCIECDKPFKPGDLVLADVAVTLHAECLAAYRESEAKLRDEVKAEIRMSEAAPDLLAACKSALRFIENAVELGYLRLPFEPDPGVVTMPQLRAAIDKAECSTR